MRGWLLILLLGTLLASALWAAKLGGLFPVGQEQDAESYLESMVHTRDRVKQQLKDTTAARDEQAFW